MHTHIANRFLTKVLRACIAEKEVFSINGVGYTKTEDEITSFPLAICKNPFRMDERSKCKIWSYEIGRRKYEGNLQDIGGEIFIAFSIECFQILNFLGVWINIL